MGTVRKLPALGAVSLLLLAAVSSIVPTGPEKGGGPVEIGGYRQFGANHDLTQQHVFWDGPRLIVKGPILTSELAMNTTFLRDQLGPRASDQEFTPGDGEINLAGREAAAYWLYPIGAHTWLDLPGWYEPGPPARW